MVILHENILVQVLKIVNINLLNIKMSTQLELDFGPEFASETLPQLNSGHYSELMDRLYIMMNNLNYYN